MLLHMTCCAAGIPFYTVVKKQRSNLQPSGNSEPSESTQLRANLEERPVALEVRAAFLAHELVVLLKVSHCGCPSY